MKHIILIVSSFVFIGCNSNGCITLKELSDRLSFNNNRAMQMWDTRCDKIIDEAKEALKKEIQEKGQCEIYHSITFEPTNKTPSNK